MEDMRRMRVKVYNDMNPLEWALFLTVPALTALILLAVFLTI